MNCILSNPYHRAKVVETGLFSDRMVKIDKDIRMNFFVEVFLKTFPISNVLLYGQPVVIRCEITINRDDNMMEHAVQDFKKIFMIDDDQLEINYSATNGNRKTVTLDEMLFEVLYKYEQIFPCSFILNMFNDDNPSMGGKKVFVVPSVKAKEATMNMLKSIIHSIDPSSELAGNKPTLKNYIDCIVDSLDEQCSSVYLFRKIENNRLWPVVPREIVINLFENFTNSEKNDEINLVNNGSQGKKDVAEFLMSKGANPDVTTLKVSWYLNLFYFPQNIPNFFS